MIPNTIYSLILNSFSTSPNCRPNVTIHAQHRHPSNRAILGSPGHSLNHMIWYTVPSLGCTYIIDRFNGFHEPILYGTLYVFLKSYHMVHCNMPTCNSSLKDDLTRLHRTHLPEWHGIVLPGSPS